MGLTNEQVIERAQEEIFEAGGVARPAWDVEEGAVDASTLTLVLEGRVSNTPPDGIVEWFDSSMEIAEVKSVSTVTVTLQQRGYLGSTAATHADGVKVILDPPYPRYVMLNALKAVVGRLGGHGIYAEAYTSSLTINNTAPVQLPTGAIDILDPILYQNGSNWFPLTKGQNYRVFYNYSGLDTAPAIQFLGGAIHGAATRILYKKEFDLSTFALTTDLETTVGLPSTLTPHLHMGLAGHVLMGRDVPSLESEHIRPDPQNPLPPGTRASVGKLLWNQFVSVLYDEHVRQHRANPIREVVS